MADTEWKEILSFSQKELVKTDKEKLCETLSWMDADDIEINFTDLKTLFKLAQDILKYRTEQVNDFLGQLKTKSNLSSKSKTRKSFKETSIKSSHKAEINQKEIVKANKETVEQRQSDITELQNQKDKSHKDIISGDKESDSSRATLSELDAVMRLENEITLKNKHMRKLLNDIKILEEENTKFKEKVVLLKDKLTDATKIINNLTEQVISLNHEYTQLKEALANSEQVKVQLSMTIETLRKELIEKKSNNENICEDIKSKVQHWKNIARSKKNEMELLYVENKKLKDLINASTLSKSHKELQLDDVNEANIKIKELQEKLSEASKEMEQSANFIQVLRRDNIRLRNIIDEKPDSSSDVKNESDDGKERTTISKLKRRIKGLTASLQVANEMITTREKELAEISTQLHLLHSDEGMSSLLEGLKSKKRELKLKDEGVKSLIQEVNDLREELNDVQLENETLRLRFNVPVEEKISTRRIQRHYRDLERNNRNMSKELRNLEDKLITLELDNRVMKSKLSEITRMSNKFGDTDSKIEVDSSDTIEGFKHIKDGQGCTSQNIQNDEVKNLEKNEMEKELQSVIEENEGLRKGLQEISEFLKDNSNTSSGILTLECPSLEAVLRCMEARHMAGWFSTHMTTAIELRSALGGKDALLTALHETRMETYDVMNQLSQESKKSLELEQKLIEMENRSKPIIKEELSIHMINLSDFGNWITDRDINSIDVSDNNQIKNIITKGHCLYEKGLTKSLEYFHIKFKTLYDKMTTLVIEATDNQNKWTIKEEQYKAQLESFKSQLEEGGDDNSDVSPGIVPVIKDSTIERKCLYIEEIYKCTKTLYENTKNENFELRKEIMAISSEYETQIQKLILSLVALTEKLRSYICFELFWKQNRILGEINLKYRKILEETLYSRNNSIEIHKYLVTNNVGSINNIQLNKNVADDLASHNKNQLRDKLKQLNIETRMQPAYSELLDEIFNKIDHLEKINKELQDDQAKMIDESLASVTKQEVDVMKSQLDTLVAENKILKEECQRVRNELKIALLQLQDNKTRQMNNDMEVNLMRHQIIDLQSSGDNKAVIARLSNEVLVTHIQSSECQNKLENLTLRLNKEKELRMEAENLINAYQKNFEVYAYRYQSKFKYIYKILQILRQQYQGSVPLICIESYLNKLEELSRKQHAVNDQLTEIEDLRSNLMIKHSVFDQILDISRNKCLIDDGSCAHKLQYVVMKNTHVRETEHLNKKLEAAETLRVELITQCNNLEKHLILVNQAFNKSNFNLIDNNNKTNKDNNTNLHIEDEQDPEEESNSRRSQTITLSKPEVLKPVLKEQLDIAKVPKDILQKEIIYTSVGTQCSTKNVPVSSIHTQTMSLNLQMFDKIVQTDEDIVLNNLKMYINDLKEDNENKRRQVSEALDIDKKRAQEILVLNSEKSIADTQIQNLHMNINEKDKFIQRLRISVDELKKQSNDIAIAQTKERGELKDRMNEENKSLLQALKQLDREKNSIVVDYKELLDNERAEYSKSIQELELKIVELETKLTRRGSDSNATNVETLKDVIAKYNMKITELEEKCFKLQSELDECKTELSTYQSEADRWKDLATERLSKMEQLNSQLEERHCHEVESYKAENEHWLSQLNETQKEHMELRTRLTEQKALYIKQLADKDVHIGQLRTVVHNLKTQVLNMQTMLSVSDPSFDLSAIAEVDEASDTLSQTGSDRLELKFESTVDMNDDEMLRIPGSSSTIWQETIIERLRREKQLAGKQNSILRRQIKALAARERRARLDAQNLKNQIFRINTSGSKVATAETTALQNKIASLQAQLTSARRDTQSNVALWDKWKRAQQAAERWQSRYEDKCQEINKLESSLNLAKSSVTRLEREKRVLLSRLSEIKSENRLTLEKQDAEPLEKSHRSVMDTNISLEQEQDESSLMFVSTHALLQRVQAQQHRIASLEIAEKGNEHLVSEYERCLAENTSLKGQVLKLESTLLESQIRTPIKKTDEPQAELDYWKGYCEMLKEENVQLTLKINSMETVPTTAQQHRVNDLEQTILTLRGLVSKLHADQKSSGVYKRTDSNQRPLSGRSGSEKNRNQLESYRIEIANLKRSIQDKDLLLERSKEMLKIAAEREDELLREIEYLRRRIDELTKPKEGF